LDSHVFVSYSSTFDGKWNVLFGEGQPTGWLASAIACASTATQVADLHDECEDLVSEWAWSNIGTLDHYTTGNGLADGIRWVDFSAIDV
jgi:hypothetical protein